MSIAVSKNNSKNKVHQGAFTSVNGRAAHSVRNKQQSSSTDLNAESSLEDQSDTVKLLLAQERRLVALEKSNEELVKQRDKFKATCIAQGKLIQVLKEHQGGTRPAPEASVTAGSDDQAVNINDLPMIDPSEFRPIEDDSDNDLQAQVSATLRGLPNDVVVVLCSVVAAIKSASAWVGNRVMSVLT